MKPTRTEPDERAPANNQQLVKELQRFATLDELRRSDFFRAREPELKRLFDEPRIYEPPAVRPRLRSFLRVVEWNIERGSRLDGIIKVLNDHPVLGFADLLLLNELDDGMLRSGNRNVALELSRALSAHAVYGVEYLEMTKGVGEELKLPGENRAALHGNAILTRHKASNPQVVRLPRCENNFESAEKRLGGRIGIIIDLEIGDAGVTAATTHLDVVNTPRCRARQMRAMLEAIDSRIRNQPGADLASRSVIVGGDLNTHTFARGNRLRAMKNTALILGSNRDSLAARFAHPERKERAIVEFARFGYETESLNDRRATGRSVVSKLDDSRSLPSPVKWWVKRRIGPEGLLLEFRLDWLAARGLRALGAGEMTDAETGVTSVDPQTLSGLTCDGLPLSDHDPIVVDLAVQGNRKR
ncbi:MAG TPA: endonuclease/exonuclease/phosphatase family protein [Blastocatellia bacterium]|nr:endonuclease/exonuclease/phosphatase family protein [Blastocatellia bacterium]